MPSMAHEVLVDLFKNRPSLGAELLTEALGVVLPSYTEARLISIDLAKIRPAEYRTDVVVLLLDGDVPVRVVIIEVQLGIDSQKHYSWPDYSTGARAARGCQEGYEYQSDFAKKYVAQGRDEGRTEEATRALLTVLRVRGITVPDEARERILAQKGPQRLGALAREGHCRRVARRGARRSELTQAPFIL